MYGATGAVGSSPIASSAIGAAGKHTATPPTPATFRRHGAIGSAPIASLAIGRWTLVSSQVVAGKAHACFHWANPNSVFSYWTAPVTNATFAVPEVAYGFSVGARNFKVVKTNAKVRSGQ